MPRIGCARWLVEPLLARAGDTLDLELEACDGAVISLMDNRRTIIAGCRAARDLGLRVGMTDGRAQELMPELRIELDESAADAAALEQPALEVLRPGRRIGIR